MSAGVLLAAIVGGVMAIIGSVLGDMVSAEVQNLLHRLPFGLLWIAGRRVPAEQREMLYDREWKPELHWILREYEARPLTRLFHGVRYSLSMIRGARSVGRLRAGHSLETESLRRLISTTFACDVLGRLSMVAARLVLTFLIGVLAGLQLPLLLGIAGTQHRLNGMTLGALLTGVFGALLGGAVALLMGPGLGWLIEERLHREPPTLWSTPALRPTHGWTLTALRKLMRWMTGEDGDQARGTPAVALAAAGMGVGLGVFTTSTPGRMSQLLVVLGVAVAVLVVLRVVLVEVVFWWYEHHQGAGRGRSGGGGPGGPAGPGGSTGAAGSAGSAGRTPPDAQA